MIPTTDDDGSSWLEDLESSAVRSWVKDRNAEALARVAAGPRFEALRMEIREVLDDPRRISYPCVRGEHLYTFRQDADHPRGVWRRTILDQYRLADPAWDIVLDLDKLAAEEDEDWVWTDLDVLRPSYDKALIGLSRGGSDAIVLREFDLSRRTFVENGFQLPGAKTRFSWMGQDRVLVATDFGPGSLTASGYPRMVKLWRRGTLLDDAELVFEGRQDDVLACAWHQPTPGFERTFVRRWIDAFRSESRQRLDDGALRPIELPDDCQWNVHREWLTIWLRSDWSTGGTSYPAGSLLAVPFEQFMAGSRHLTRVFTPTGHTSLISWTWTRNHLMLSHASHVVPKLEILTPANGRWQRRNLALGSDVGNAWVVDTSPDDNDDYLVAADGFLEPATLQRGHVDAGIVEVLKEEPAFFNADGMTARQFFATSADATRVPYFVVTGAEESSAPTLLYGYGGFCDSQLPAYDSIVGRGWLARGGTYVVANIRGGGEYGPDWHQAARRRARHKAFEDFAAVAADLTRHGITTPAQLGVDGGSNGGLLAAVMLTRYPELFGAVVSRVPLTDMLRFHKLLAGASWVAEYGDPEDSEDAAYLASYSPFHNIKPGPYPPILLITSTRDDRVHPGHARKMAERLRQQGHDVTYYENTSGGHNAASDNEQRAFVHALKLEFLWQRLSDAHR